MIQHAVWLYHCFSLSLRDVETILAARGVVVSYETIRDWSLRFGRLFGSVKNLGRYAASWIAGWPRRPSSTAALTAALT